MRAARAVFPGLFRAPVGPVLGRNPATSDKGQKMRTTRFVPNAGVLFVILFFAGYLGGIFKGRECSSDFGELLAAYYMNSSSYTSFFSRFLDIFGNAFLQSILVLLCGFSAMGSLFLGLYFAARGAVLGLCAACVFVQGGTRALVVHWMLTCLPDLGVFLVMLWLSIRANRCACLIFRTAILNSGHLRQSFPLRQLLMHFLTALLLCTGCCLLGAASGVIFAGVLL